MTLCIMNSEELCAVLKSKGIAEDQTEKLKGRHGFCCVTSCMYNLYSWVGVILRPHGRQISATVRYFPYARIAYGCTLFSARADGKLTQMFAIFCSGWKISATVRYNDFLSHDLRFRT